MSLVVPAEKTDAVHTETDRVERILVVDDDVPFTYLAATLFRR